MTQELNSLIEQQLIWRYATKRFDPTKKISQNDLHTLEESLRLSPSSFGLQPWKTNFAPLEIILSLAIVDFLTKSNQ
jgi:nitroreductase